MSRANASTPPNQQIITTQETLYALPWRYTTIREVDTCHRVSWPDYGAIR